MLANRVIKSAKTRTSNNLVFQGGDNYIFQDDNNCILNDKQTSFSFVVKTDNTGTSNSDQFTAPTVSGGTYDCIVYKGDSISDEITTWNDAAWTHTYPANSTYKMSIEGVVTGWRFNNAGDEEKLISISQWGNLDLTNLSGAFFGCNKLTAITATDYPKFLNSSNGTVLISLFFNCNILTYISNVEQWEALNIGTRQNMFLNCNKFNQDVTNLITGNVHTITNMLRNCTLFDQDLSGADFSGVSTATNFMQGTTAISTANYDALLISLAGQSLQTGVNIHFGGATYSAGAAATARAYIISTFSWTITDGGPA